MATKHSNDLIDTLSAANTNMMELEQHYQNYHHHMAMMQENTAQHISMFGQQRIRTQYETDRM